MPADPTEFRQNVRAGVKQLLDSYQVIGSNNGLLFHTFDAQPPDFDPPLAFVGNMSEVILNPGDEGGWQSIRQRRMTVEAVVVRGTFDNAEQLRLTDVLVDGLVDHFTDNPHGITGLTLLEPTNVDDAVRESGGIPYLTSTITLRSLIGEGRD